MDALGRRQGGRGYDIREVEGLDWTLFLVVVPFLCD